MRALAVVWLVACVSGCAEEGEEFGEPRTAAHLANGGTLRCVELPHPSADDSFAISQAISEATRPPPMHQQSLSLGFVGDDPLSGSVMRDTQMMPAQGSPYMPRTWQDYQSAPSWPAAVQPPRYGFYGSNPYAYGR